MGYFVGIPLGGAAEKDCQVRFGKNMTFKWKRVLLTCRRSGHCRVAYSLHGLMRIRIGPICLKKCSNVL